MELPKNIWRQIATVSLISVLTSCSITPTPFPLQERTTNLQHDIINLNEARPELPHHLSLNHAIARALKYNLDYRMKLTEEAIAETDMGVSNANMLPNLVANAGYVHRNNFNEILSPTTGQVSTSEDRIRRLEDLTFSWNILDFGVSYFESKQKADQVLIAAQEKRKMMEKLAKDTRKAFWRAYAAAHYLSSAQNYKSELEEVINNLDVAEKKKLLPPIYSARYRRDLRVLYNEILNINFELSQSKPELMNLISAPSRAQAILVASDNERIDIARHLPRRLDKLEQLALFYRPELQEENYRKRIGLNEVNKARLRLLPGFELNYGSYRDTNSYLVNNSWNQTSLSVSWNIIKLLANFKSLKLAEQQKYLTEIRRVALSMAIVTQVDIAKLAYNFAKLNYYNNEQVYKEEHKIYKILLKQQANFENKFTLTKARGSMILARLKRDLAYADYQTAAAELVSSVGLDPVYDPNSTNLPLHELTKIIDQKNHLPIYNREHIEQLLKSVPSVA